MRYLVTWKFLQVPPQMAKTELALLEATETWIEEQKRQDFVLKYGNTLMVGVELQ